MSVSSPGLSSRPISSCTDGDVRATDLAELVLDADSGQFRLRLSVTSGTRRRSTESRRSDG